jgi:hypothetical protein
VAGPITFQLGADAVLGHGSAVHWLSCSRGTIAGETSPRLMRMDIEVSRGLGCESHRQLSEADQALGMRTSRAFLEREQLNQENKKDPRLTPRSCRTRHFAD